MSMGLESPIAYHRAICINFFSNYQFFCLRLQESLAFELSLLDTLDIIVVHVSMYDFIHKTVLKGLKFA